MLAVPLAHRERTARARLSTRTARPLHESRAAGGVAPAHAARVSRAPRDAARRKHLPGWEAHRVAGRVPPPVIANRLRRRWTARPVLCRHTSAAAAPTGQRWRERAR